MPATFVAASHEVACESRDCGAGGDVPFLLANRVGPQAQRQGLITRSVALPHDTGDTIRDASTYWSSPPGAALETVTLRSIKETSAAFGRAVNCREPDDLQTEVLRLSPNDPGVTGIPNRPWDGVPAIVGS